MSRRDLGSLFEEEGQGATPAPSAAPRPAPVEESLINDEARQMLEERSRAARESTARAAEIAAQKGKEFGKAALGALGRLKEEHKRRAQAKAQAKPAAPEEVAPLEGITPEEVRSVLPVPEEPAREPKGVLIFNGMGQLPDVIEPLRGEDITMAAPMSVSVAFDSTDDEAREVLLRAQQESVEVFAGRQPVADPVAVVEVDSERAADRPAQARIEAQAETRTNKYVWIAGGLLALAAAGGGAYWWSTLPAGEHVGPPKVEATPAVISVQPATAPEIEAPVAVPAPVEEMAPAPASVEEVPRPPVVEQSAPVTAPAPKEEPAPVVTASKQTPKPVPKQKPKKIEPAPTPAAPAKEEQQIEQIRDFGKQLEQFGKR